MRRIYRSFIALASLFACLPLHVGHGAAGVRQNFPPWLMKLLTRYEHLFMRAIEYLAGRDWIYSREAPRKLVARLADLVMKVANGEVLTLDEARLMVRGAASLGITVAVGTCPCRRAGNRLSDVAPNNTDMVFGRWAEEYLVNYPGLYRRVDAEEALGLVEEFDRHGFLHQVYGFLGREGAAFVLCNCAPDVCIPLRAQKSRGFQSFRRGRALAVVDRGACVGTDECGACLSRCPFDARTVDGGKAAVVADACFGCGLCLSTCRGSATRLEAKKGAELVYARLLVEEGERLPA